MNNICYAHGMFVLRSLAGAAEAKVSTLKRELAKEKLWIDELRSKITILIAAPRPEPSETELTVPTGGA